MKRVLWACLLAMLAIGASAQEPSSPRLQEIEGLIKNTEDLPKLSQALDKCRVILKREPDNLQALAYTCKICWNLGVQIESEERSQAMFELGFKQAQKLKKLHPGKPDGYYWYAVNYGKFIERASIFTKMGAMGDIMDDAKKTIELQPAYDSGGAYLIVGRINQLSPTGSEATAEDCFRKAIGISPARPSAHLYMGQLRYDQGKYQDALAEMKKIVEGKDPKYSVERRMNLAEAKKWIEKIEDKLGKD